MKILTSFILWLALINFPLLAHAAAADINTLDQLLQHVRKTKTLDTAENRKREVQFIAQKDQRKRLLAEALRELKTQEKKEKTLKAQFDANEKLLTQEEEKLHMSLGSLGELFGVVRQVAADTHAILEQSLVTAQNPGRQASLKPLMASKSTPDINELEELWLALQDEMTNSGKVVSFPAEVIGVDGQASRQQVTRVGVFNVVSNGKYLRHITETGQLVELARQPASRYLDLAAGLESASQGVHAVGIDPSRGSIMSLLVQTPDLGERVQQGKLIGYIIIAIAAIGLLIALERMIRLQIIKRRINAQMKTTEPSASNPLGQIMSVYQSNSSLDANSLSRKLDEVVLKNIPPLQRGISTIKILAMIAPLLGLLGTVTGMIETFQSITLFGTGDPKLMAGGISQALVTTALGLVAAIPLILSHTFVNSRSRHIIDILDEQSAGFLALQTEQGKT